MSLASYTDLLASVASWMNRTDLTTVIPDFVTIAESRIARDLRLREQSTAGTLTTSISTRAVALPTDWLEFSNVVIDGDPATSCQFVANEYLNTRFPNESYAGRPYFYSIEGDSVLFGPMPDDAYTVNIDYVARFPDLATNSTNWLLTNHPNVYLYACLREACFFVKDKEGAAQWDGLFKQEVGTLQKHDDDASHSGSAMRVRTL
jgi:hypothetical protein